ncbi:nucleotidyltransferase family protein [Pelodictyon luteolum]|uniref:Nucleotidyltransferase n=1 Tax=Chlorobium luteolum (strain DSM 273 / BCRC 81028 / 2530) TaxID=319225 RepID=Q3B1D2_CHLL3|nr:nucleotidyltransferase family protein [Pelodictyon luteolum]ABB24849.1 nucleotidyltransferase [Pelodictyon luteolum DSM 273]
MKAFVLAAGFGTRLRPLTEHLPKPLVPVMNIPGLFYTFALLKQAGITEIICNIHHHAEQIRRFIEESRLPGLCITFSEEPSILGTGGGLKRCEPLLKGGDFLLVNSDIITDIDFRALIEQHRRSQRAGTLCLYETPEAASIGMVGIEGELVRDFAGRRGTGIESSFIYTGSAVFSPEIFRHLETGFSSIVETGFYGLVERNTLGYHPHRGLWQDIGTLESYLRANLDTPAVPDRLGAILEHALGMRPHRIAPDARIASDASITHSVIGSGCVIGKGCRVQRSVLLPGTVVEAGTVVEDSVADQYGATLVKPKPAARNIIMEQNQ